jgi:hypothetical protein
MLAGKSGIGGSALADPLTTRVNKIAAQTAAGDIRLKETKVLEMDMEVWLDFLDQDAHTVELRLRY